MTIDQLAHAQSIIDLTHTLDRMTGGMQNRFRMEWNGNKTPIGATIGGIPIGAMRYNVITGTDREDLGRYDREVEFSGANRDKHVVIITTDHTEVTPPEGGKVEPVAPTQGKSI